MNRTELPSHPHTPPEHRPDHGEYGQRENRLKTRKCPECDQWIGLGPKGGEWPFEQHVGSNSCAREKKRKELEAIRPVSKATSYTDVVTSRPPFSAMPAPFVLTYPLVPGSRTSLLSRFSPLHSFSSKFKAPKHSFKS